tara:strand:- start:6913 stop:7155 length:243 start_codon:yes stop_codon:yes gene_type:complete
MPTLHIDYDQTVARVSVGSTDTDDSSWEDEVCVIPVCIPSSQVSAWLTAYDPSNQYSPNAADSRTIARAVLDALNKCQGG